MEVPKTEEVKREESKNTPEQNITSLGKFLSRPYSYIIEFISVSLLPDCPKFFIITASGFPLVLQFLHLSRKHNLDSPLQYNT